MLLRKLETYGFKSFADKTELEFGRGVTVIVGPNGSGKSNISDAIRWVLGEQSVRNLRGSKMEDVIFAGSLGRRALGVAEVSLTFDNSDNTLPLDFNEVTITRRVFRSGDSEYYINKAHCRLKDIHDLLADTGLGRDAMPVIGQSKIDEILNSKADERRLVFEEASGITKYKQRKKEGLRKLEDTTQNLLRVADITAEIENQLVPMAQSAARTTCYNELYAELLACQVTSLLNKLSKARKMVESATLQQSALIDDEIAASTNLILQETEKERLTQQLTQVDEQMVGFGAAIHEVDTGLERIEGKIAVLEERIQQGQRAEERLKDEFSRNEQQKRELEQKLARLKDSLAVKQEQAIKCHQALDHKTLDYQENMISIQEIEQQLETNKEKTVDYLQEILNSRNQLVTMERDISRLKLLQTGFQKEQQDNVSQVGQAELQYKNLLEKRQEWQTIVAELQTKREALVLQKHSKEQELLYTLAQEKQVTNQWSEQNSRLKVLVSMQHDYEGFGRGIKHILKSDAAWRRGVCGSVA